MTSDWIENARGAQKLLVGKRHGELERSLLDAGWKDANTARRAIAALSTSITLNKTKPRFMAPCGTLRFPSWNCWRGGMHSTQRGHRRKQLSGLGQSTVSEPLRRHSAMLENWIRKRRPRKMRPPGPGQSVKAPLIAKLKNLLPGSLSEPALNFKATASPPVDYRFEWFVEDGGVKIRTIAVLIVGPYQNTVLYSKRRHDWIMKAFGLNWFFDRVFLVLPRLSLAEQYSSWIRVCEGRAADLTANLRRPEVDVVVIPQAAIQRLSAEEHEAVARLGN